MMNDNDRNNIDMNNNLWNGDVSIGIVLLNNRTLPQDKESNNLNDMNMSVDNGDVNGDYFYMNIFTRSYSNIQNFIDYTIKNNFFDQ